MDATVGGRFSIDTFVWHWRGYGPTSDSRLQTAVQVHGRHPASRHPDTEAQLAVNGSTSIQGSSSVERSPVVGGSTSVFEQKPSLMTAAYATAVIQNRAHTNSRMADRRPRRSQWG